jgi:hypothetical protein
VGDVSDGTDGALGTSSGTGGLPAPKRKKAAYMHIWAPVNVPRGPCRPSFRRAGRGRRPRTTPGVPGSSPGSSGRTGRRRPPGVQNAQEPAYRLVHSVHRFTEFIGFTGSQVHRLRVESLQAHRGCAFSVFVFRSFPASGREGPGAGRTSPRTGGPDGSSRCRDREVRAWVGSDGSPGPPPAGPGGRNEQQTPLCSFSARGPSGD